MADISPLRHRMIEDMTVRNLSPATQRSYIHAVSKFSRFFGRSPDRLGLEDLREFQVYLVSQGISWPALNQTVCALRFFYGVTLKRDEMPERIPYSLHHHLHQRQDERLFTALVTTEDVGRKASVSCLRHLKGDRADPRVKRARPVSVTVALPLFRALVLVRTKALNDLRFQNLVQDRLYQLRKPILTAQKSWQEILADVNIIPSHRFAPSVKNASESSSTEPKWWLPTSEFTALYGRNRF